MEQSSRTLKFVWKLENFCFCDFYCNRRLSSRIFTVNVPVQCQWSLYMFPNGYGTGKYVGIYLKRSEKDYGPKEIKVSFRISLVDDRGELCPDACFIDQIFTRGREWGHNEFIKRKDLHTGSSFLSLDTLTVFCELNILSCLVGIYCRRISGQIQLTNEVHNICKGMKLLYEDKMYNDITLQGKSKMFSIHKCILKARLPELFRMLIRCPDRIFENDFVTEKILLYAYTGKLDFKDLDFVDIPRILSKYELDHLQSRILSHPVEYTATTYFSIQKHNFHWEISVLTLNNENEVISPLLSNGQTAFILTLIKSEDNVLKLIIKVISNDDIFIRCKVSVHKRDDIYKELEHSFECNTYWESNLPLQLTDNFLIFNYCYVPRSKDMFALDFTFTYPTGDIHQNMESISSCSQPSSSCLIDDSPNLLTALEELYYGGNEADIIVQAGSRAFKVHKCILAARSPCFQAMLEHEMKEKTENLILIKDDGLDQDFLAEVIDKLLLYTYCGKFDAPSPEMEDQLNSKIDMYLIGENYEKIDDNIYQQ